MDAIEHAYNLVSYRDPFGRHIVDLSELDEVVPHYMSTRTYRWNDDRVERLRDYIGLRAHVWVCDRWEALARCALPAALYVPTVFTIDGLFYVIQDSPAEMIDGRWVVRAAPLATRVGGVTIANHDPITASGRGVVGSGYKFVERLRHKAIRENPGLSFTIAAAHGVDLSCLRVLDHIKGGRLRGATLYDTGEGTVRFVSHADGASCLLGHAKAHLTAKGAMGEVR